MKRTRKNLTYRLWVHRWAGLLVLSLTAGPIASAYALKVEQPQQASGLEELTRRISPTAGLEERDEIEQMREALEAWPPKTLPVAIQGEEKPGPGFRGRFGSTDVFILRHTAAGRFRNNSGGRVIPAMDSAASGAEC